MGHHDKYTKAQKTMLAQAVFSCMCEGMSTRAACRACSVPVGTLLLWISEDVALAEQYRAARSLLLDVIAEDALEIANTPLEGVKTTYDKDGTKEVHEDMLGHRRLQVETRKWFLSKLAPRKYGDKLELAGDAENPITIATIKRTVVKPK